MQDKKKNKRRPLISLIVISIIIGIIISFYEVNYKMNYDGDSLIGVFLYEENKTKYIFNEDGTGSMYSDDYKYDYTYNVSENILDIEFLENNVHDVSYYFELNNGVLSLTSKDGTVTINKKYILKKVNK